MNKREEYYEAVALKHYLDMLMAQGKVLQYSHVVNEFKLGRSMMGLIVSMKAQGWRKGVPDYIIVTPSTVLFLELKKPTGGVVSKEQKAWISSLQDRTGVVAGVAKGFEQAKELVDSCI